MEWPGGQRPDILDAIENPGASSTSKLLTVQSPVRIAAVVAVGRNSIAKRGKDESKCPLGKEGTSHTNTFGPSIHMSICPPDQPSTKRVSVSESPRQTAKHGTSLLWPQHSQLTHFHACRPENLPSVSCALAIACTLRYSKPSALVGARLALAHRHVRSDWGSETKSDEGREGEACDFTNGEAAADAIMRGRDSFSASHMRARLHGAGCRSCNPSGTGGRREGVIIRLGAKGR